MVLFAESIWLMSRVLEQAILIIVGSCSLSCWSEFSEILGCSPHCDSRLSSSLCVAKWEKPFNPTYTSKMYPFVVGKTTVKVPMMHQVEQLAFGVDPELNCSVLQMDYKGGSTALFVLPSPGKMRQLEQALSSRTLRKWTHLLKKRWAPVSICWGLRQVVVNIPG